MHTTHQRTWLLKDGCWKSEASLPLTDRGLRYGMSVFETLGVRDGQPLFANEHQALLTESAGTLLGMAAKDVPSSFPELGANATGMLRIYITAGDGSPLEAFKTPRIFAFYEASDNSPLPPHQTARQHPVPVAPFGGGRKTGNYWAHSEAQRAAQVASFDHALLNDHQGFLLSAAFANVFFVLDGKLCTPPLSLAVRPGVLRAWVMRQHPTYEIAWPGEQLNEASEIFITNSRLGVMPLLFEKISPGPLGKKLRALGLRQKITP